MDTTDTTLKCSICLEECLNEARYDRTTSLCRSCIDTLFQNALRDEAEYPAHFRPTTRLSLRDYRRFLDAETITAYEHKELEYGTHPINRVYCVCEVYVGSLVKSMPAHIKVIAKCPNDCNKVWCLVCATELESFAQYDDHDCKTKLDGKVRQKSLELEGLERGVQYLLCPTCGRRVELIEACNHICCHCNCQFCFVCGEPALEGSGHWNAGGCPRYGPRRGNTREPRNIGGMDFPGGPDPLRHLYEAFQAHRAQRGQENVRFAPHRIHTEPAHSDADTGFGDDAEAGAEAEPATPHLTAREEPAARLSDMLNFLPGCETAGTGAPDDGSSHADASIGSTAPRTRGRRGRDRGRATVARLMENATRARLAADRNDIAPSYPQGTTNFYTNPSSKQPGPQTYMPTGPMFFNGTNIPPPPLPPAPPGSVPRFPFWTQVPVPGHLDQVAPGYARTSPMSSPNPVPASPAYRPTSPPFRPGALQSLSDWPAYHPTYPPTTAYSPTSPADSPPQVPRTYMPPHERDPAVTAVSNRIEDIQRTSYEQQMRARFSATATSTPYGGFQAGNMSHINPSRRANFGMAPTSSSHVAFDHLPRASYLQPFSHPGPPQPPAPVDFGMTLPRAPTSGNVTAINTFANFPRSDVAPSRRRRLSSASRQRETGEMRASQEKMDEDGAWEDAGEKTAEEMAERMQWQEYQ